MNRAESDDSPAMTLGVPGGRLIVRVSLVITLADIAIVCLSLFPIHVVLVPYLRSYSAETAAFAYSHMDPSRVSRVFVLGPSHHVHMRWVVCSIVAIYASGRAQVIDPRRYFPT